LLGEPFDAERFHCWTLVRRALSARFDIEVPEHGGVSSTGDLRDIAEAAKREAAKGWLPVDAGAETPGDVLVFDFIGSPAHVGVVVADGLFLHVSEGIVSRVESYRDHFWARRLCQRWRHPVIAARDPAAHDEVLPQAVRLR